MSSFPNLECDQNKGYLVATHVSNYPLPRIKILVEAYSVSVVPYLPAKYAHFLRRGEAGLTDRHAVMINTIRQALVRERIPVMGSLRLAAQHNHGIPITPEEEQWETYFNLENVTAIFRRQDDNAVMSAGPVKVLTLSRFLKETWPQTLFRRKLPFGQKSKGQWLDDLPYEGNESPILRAIFDDRKGKSLESKLLKEHGLTIDIQIPPSQKVKSIAQGVIDELQLDGKYYVLHVRRGDMVQKNEFLETATQPETIIKKIKDIFPEKAILYIMTNEWDRKFFDPMKARYRVRRYFNFPKLAELVYGKTPNNYLLFAVEQVIASQATKQCRTFVNSETIRKNIPTLTEKRWYG